MLDLVVAKQDIDMELVCLARSGNAAAFDTLFHNHKKSVFNICLGILGSYEDATDATQTTFIQAFKAIKSFRGNSNFKTWLYRIAQNASIELIRKRKRRQECVLEVDVPDTVSPCDERVWEAILNLAPDLRVVLVLYYFQGLSGRELAESLGCKEGAARTRLHRARQEFKEKYEEVCV